MLRFHDVRRFRVFWVLLCSLALLGMQGCVPQGGHRSATSKTITPSPPPAPNLYQQAHNALVKKEYAKAELLAQRFLHQSQLSQQEFADGSALYSRAASMNKHPNAALAALEAWRLKVGGSDRALIWQEIWSDSMGQLNPREGLARCEAILGDANRSTGVRSMALAYKSLTEWGMGKTDLPAEELKNYYSQLTAGEEKASLEQSLARELVKAPTAALSVAAELVTPENKLVFPYSLIMIDQLRRQLHNPGTKEQALSSLQHLRAELQLADSSLVDGPRKAELPSMQATSPSLFAAVRGDGKPVVLALPLSSPLSKVSTKIAAGAEAACHELTAAGTPVSLILIDTDQEGWTDRIQALPPEAVVVGGPLRVSDFSVVKAQGIVASRAFFAFSPSLEPGDEGRVAWRFFTSASDQIAALVGLLKRLEVHGSAVFYPEESYGVKMAELFQQQAAESGISVSGKMGYDPGNPAGWLRSVGNLMSLNKNPESASSATFRAVFLPDTWKSMDMIVPNIFYYGETRQLLLGTALWGQELSGKAFVDPQYYGLAVFPGAWDNSAASPLASRLQTAFSASGKGKADFWSGLGYDFARFAAALPVTNGFSPASVNSALSQVSMSFSMAPLKWNTDGKASQQLYLFSPTEDGFSLLNEGELSTAYKNAWQ